MNRFSIKWQEQLTHLFMQPVALGAPGQLPTLPLVNQPRVFPKLSYSLSNQL